MERRLLLFIALASMLLAGNAMAATDLAHADTSVQGLLGVPAEFGKNRTLRFSGQS